MIRLSLLRGPVEADLSDLYPGLKVTLRRLTSPEIGEARDAALEVLRQAREGLEALEVYGLAGEDVHGRRLNPTDPHQMLRAGMLVGQVEIAVRAIEAWEGVCLEDGEVAPVNRETLSLLLLDDAISRRLMREIEQACRVLISEGNGSGPSPAGSSAIRPKTKAEQATATGAGKPANPALEGRGGDRGATAPRSRTRRAPPKAPPSGGS